MVFCLFLASTNSLKKLTFSYMMMLLVLT